MKPIDVSEANNEFERGRLLYGIQRYREAIAQFAEHLKFNEDDPRATAYIALCLMRLGDKRRAVEVARQAITQDPDEVFTHLVLVQVLRTRGQLGEAREAMKAALALAPYRADVLGTAANLACDQKKWSEAMELTEEGLALDAYDENCISARGWALINIGRCEEAQVLLRQALVDHPEDADYQSLLGYASLRLGRGEEALEYFISALRTEPENDMAREGFLNALRSRYPIYGLVVRYILWLSTLSTQVRLALMFAEHFIERFLNEMARRHPWLRPLIQGLLFAWSVFSYLTLMARPVGNTLLRFSPQGRKILRADEILESNLISASLLLCGAGWLHWHFLGGTWSLVAFLVSLTMVLPLTNIFHCPEGWPRKVMGAFALVMWVLGNLAIWGFYDSPLTGGAAQDCLRFYALLMLANQLLCSQLEKVSVD